MANAIQWGLQNATPAGWLGMWDGKSNVNNSGAQPGQPGYIGMDPGAIAQSGAYNPLAMNAFTNNAMRTGPSQGAQMALRDNTKQNALAMDQSRGMAMGQAKQAQSNLAMRGGLSSGAAERVQQNATNNALAMNQKNSADYGRNASNIKIADENSKMNQLGAANEMQLGAANQGLAVNNAQAQELFRRNAFNQNLYNQQMSAWGASKTADAQQNANSGGFLTKIVDGIFG